MPSLLLVDNDTHFLSDLELWTSDKLRCTVTAATSVQAAIEIANSRAFDIAIVDLRLEREEDDTDNSGYELCRQLPAGILRILVSIHEVERDILSMWLASHAIHMYWPLDCNPPDLLKKISHVLYGEQRRADTIVAPHKPPHYCTTNFDLEVTMNGRREEPTPQAWSSLLARARLPNSDANGDFLSMLMHRLFGREIDQVDLVPVAGGGSGCGALRVTVTHRRTQLKEQVIVKYGSKNVGKERSNFWEYVAPLGPRWSAQVRWDARVELPGDEELCAIAYWLVQPHEEVITPARFLNEVIEDPQCRPEDEASLITAIFSNMCKRWYKAMRPPTELGDISIREYYLNKLWSEGEQGVVEKLNETRSWLMQEQVIIPAADGTLRAQPESESLPIDARFRDPLILIQGENTQSWPKLRAECIVHGDLHVRNICVVDRDPCLIDFGDCGYGHVFRDFAMLEVSIRYGLSPANGDFTKVFYVTMPLNEVWGIEQKLISRPMLSPDWELDGKPSAERIARLTMRIRQEAQLVAWRTRKLIPEKQDDLEYAIALFFSLLKMAGIKRLHSDEADKSAMKRRLIAFMAAGKLSESLVKDIGPSHDVSPSTS